MDNDHSTSVEVIEFLTFFDLDRSSFALKAFSVMDFDGSGSINFFEFALSTWNYCTLTTKNLEVFAFDLYDSDGSGCINKGEAEEMCKQLYGECQEKRGCLSGPWFVLIYSSQVRTGHKPNKLRPSLIACRIS